MWTDGGMHKFLRMSEPVAKSYGYVLAVAGSVPRTGRGRDLDVFAIRHDLKGRESAEGRRAFIALLCNTLNTYACDGTLTDDGAMIAWGNNHWIDFTFA